jgi:hypothetical protein
MTERSLSTSSKVPGFLEASRRAKAEETSRQAKLLIDAETEARIGKTAKLREQRETKAAANRAAQVDASSRKTSTEKP